MHDLGVIDRGHVRMAGGFIEAVGPGDPPERGAAPGEETIDAGGAVVMPAFVDCHTHACWAGDRFDEFEKKIAGIGYLDMLRAGGGIMSTVRAVRAASQERLTDLLLHRLSRMAALGTATAEVKSGYGLTPRDELKMLRAIRAAQGRTTMRLSPTFLGAHAIDPDQPDFVERTINETLPLVESEFRGITCDAYCEEGAWSLADVRRLFENARDLGCPIRVHADQFNSLGMTRLATEMGAVSVDHLEAAAPKDLEHLARSETIGVALPCAGFHLDGKYAPARELIDGGGALAIATNYNPGSAPTPSMPFTIALACRKLRLTVAEAITCATVNAACVLGMQFEAGSIEEGMRADVQVLDTVDERELGFEFATPGPRAVIIGGEVIYRRDPSPARAGWA
jgi:imidazolonepropionase